MSRVGLHETAGRDIGKVLAAFPDYVAAIIEMLPRKTRNLGLGSTRGLRSLGAALHQAADPSTILRCLRFARDCSLAALRISQPAPGSETVTIDGQQLTLERRGPWATSADWETAFFATMLLRDHEELAWVSAYPLATLQAAPGVSAPDYVWMKIDALQRFALDEHGWNALLAETIDRASSSPEASPFTRDFTLPQLRVLQAIYSDDATFDAALRGALSRHVAHYTRGSNRNDPAGFFSLPLTALAARAHDVRTPVTIEADYLPGWLITGRW